MAADGIVSAIVQTSLGIFSSAALQEIGPLWGLKDDLDTLESTFGTIQLVLQDAEVKRKKYNAINHWLGKLKNTAYDAENILDRIATNGLRRRVHSERGTLHRLKSFLSLRNPLLFRLKMVRQVRNIKGKLDAVAKERLEYHLGEGVMESLFGETLESRHTSSLVNELEIVGRKREKEMIIEKLLDCSCDREDLSVCTIWGMGGLGKTTLAQFVYNDERTKKHFELRIWVCVSDDFSVQRLVRAVIESLEGGGCNISEPDPLQRRLQERLGGKRFLLVLDDVWSENYRLWDELKEVLRCGLNGSALMVTTRIEKVALMMATSTIHHIGYLSEDDSWSLFRQRAFPNGEKEEKNLVAIGEVIVKKCGGVPLAIKALGSLMRYKCHESEWMAIKESEIWHLSDAENGILPALRLSYDNLQPQTRQCFAFCCIFPKDCEMEKNMLIQLWMANGYIPSDGQTDLHLIGDLIFKELVSRSFFQDVEINFEGNVACKMHDLMHDLALFVMRQETYILEHGKELKIPRTLRHFCFHLDSTCGFDSKNKLKLPTHNSLRSIIVLGTRDVPSWRKGFSSLLSKQEYLRALDVNHFIMEKGLLKFICKLEHLRYLVLSCSGIKKLPESLTGLLNLQTLKLTDSQELVELPKQLSVIKSLWFLDLECFDSLLCTPPGLGDLTCLCRLSVFIVGQDVSHQINQLNKLNLGGELSIQGLDNMSNLEEAKSANLMSKKNLTSLSLSWTKGITENSTQNFEEVLEGLQPHQNLEKICIKSYQGSTFPNWMSSLAFEKLKEISLEICPRCEHLPPFGKLPSLTRLDLYAMGSLKLFDAESYGDGETSFPALTSLTISGMPNLEKWSIADSVWGFPCLNHLEIRKCPKLTKLPDLPVLKSLAISTSSSALLRSITSVPSLTSLNLFNFAEFDIFPEGLLKNHTSLEILHIGVLPISSLTYGLDNLSALRTLNLTSCSNLEFLPEGIKYLNNLERLDIKGCDALISFPASILEGLSSLKSLSFQKCKKLKPLIGPLKQQHALHDLVLNGLPELENLPESMQMLSDIRELSIWYCEGLYSLPNWLSCNASLLKIDIWSCTNLNSLPDGLKSLKLLRKLDIKGCPQLEKRCEKPKGENCQKISHIPIVRMNWKTVQCLD